MEAGVQIDDEHTAPCKIHILNDTTFKIILTEGKKHQIRRMCVALFQEVLDLKRTRIMNIQISNIAEGDYRTIVGEELQTFLRSLELA
jgi:pseudouridine synthase